MVSIWMSDFEELCHLQVLANTISISQLHRFIEGFSVLSRVPFCYISKYYKRRRIKIMSMLSVKGASVGDKNLEATLNPNAAEFVPFALRPRVGSITIPDASSKFSAASPTTGKSVLDRSGSSISANSDEEAQQYWHHQLPDDITPDFKVLGIEDNQDTNNLSFSNLSLSDVNEGSRYTSSTSSGFMLKGLNGNGLAEKLKYPISSYGEYPSPTSFQPSFAKPWEKQIVSNNQLLARERHPYDGNSSQPFLADMSNEQLLLDNANASPLEFLASKFPGFAAERLAEVFLSTGGDLKLTIEMLTQLEVCYFLTDIA